MRNIVFLCALLSGCSHTTPTAIDIENIRNNFVITSVKSDKTANILISCITNSLIEAHGTAHFNTRTIGNEINVVGTYGFEAFTGNTWPIYAFSILTVGNGSVMNIRKTGFKEILIDFFEHD